MIETSLVHIYPLGDRDKFVGCGAIVEGGYIATCRHVWRDAGGPDAPEGAITIIYPQFRENGEPATRRAILADPCEKDEKGRRPDLVLLRVVEIPVELTWEGLTIARDKDFEHGEGYAYARLHSRKKDVLIFGKIAHLVDADGQRNFGVSDPGRYWLEPGSSGSPVLLSGHQNLAGIVSLAEKGPQETRLHEAFIVPGTVIWFFVRNAQALPIAERENVDVARFREILSQLGHENVPASEIPAKLEAAISEMKARAAEPVLRSNEGEDITATVAAARAKLDDLDTQGALALLKEKRAEASEARKDAVKREVRLLEEQAAIERMAYDYEAAKTTLGELLRLDSEQVWRWMDLGDVWETTGFLDEAARAFGAAKDAAQRTGNERDIGASCIRLGDVRRAQGDLAGALNAYNDGLAIADRLAKSDPDNAEWQRDLSVSYDRVGDVRSAQGDLAGALNAYQDGLAIADRLAKSDPDNAEWQRDLSVSYDRVGDVRRAQGDLAGALNAYQDGLAIADRLAQSDPGNAGWQRDLSVSYDRVGDVRRAQGDLAGALKAYSDGLAIRDRLAQSDPGNAEWQRDLSVSYDRVGDVRRAQGDLAGALKAYSDGLAIRDRLAQSDPGNAEWQRDLSVSYEKIGDVRRAQGDLAGAVTAYQDGLAIADRVAKSDPGNAGWQRDLSVSYNKIGNVRIAQADLAGALKSYQDDLAIADRLAKSDPGNAGWQRDLAVSFGKLGLVYQQSGDATRALGALRQGRAIMSRLTELSPENAGWKQDLAWFDRHIGELVPQSFDGSPAAETRP